MANTTVFDLNNGFGDPAPTTGLVRYSYGAHIVQLDTSSGVGEYELSLSGEILARHPSHNVELNADVFVEIDPRRAYVRPLWASHTYAAQLADGPSVFTQPEPGLVTEGAVPRFVPQLNVVGLSTRVDLGLETLVGYLAWDPITMRQNAHYRGFVTGPNPPTLTEPHSYTWSSHLRPLIAFAQNQQAPTSGFIPTQLPFLPDVQSYYFQPYFFKLLGPWEFTWSDAVSRDTVLLKYIFEDGAIIEPYADVHLHPSDENPQEYGYIKWQVYDPVGSVEEYVMDWTDIRFNGTATFDPILPFTRWLLGAIENSFMLFVTGTPHGRIATILKGLGISFPSVIPPPVTVSISPPNQDDFNLAVQEGRCPATWAGRSVGEFMWRAGGRIHNRALCYVSKQFGPNGFIGQTTSKREVRGMTKNIFWFKEIGR